MATYYPSSLNDACLVRNRRLNFSRNVRNNIELMGEDKVGRNKLEEVHWSEPSSTKPTFIMIFCPNGQRVASTHGDHRIYICDLYSGKLQHTLDGHSKTPWCLAWHPTNYDILASGCLSGEVRVWDLKSQACESWTCDNKAIITSISFHPNERILVIGTGNQIYFWDWSESEPFAKTDTTHVRQKVKYVQFDSSGNKLITGITNLPIITGSGAGDSLQTRIIDSYLSVQGILDNNPPSSSVGETTQINSNPSTSTATISTLTRTRNMTQSSENRTHNSNRNNTNTFKSRRPLIRSGSHPRRSHDDIGGLRVNLPGDNAPCPSASTSSSSTVTNTNSSTLPRYGCRRSTAPAKNTRAHEERGCIQQEISHRCTTALTGLAKMYRHLEYLEESMRYTSFSPITANPRLCPANSEIPSVESTNELSELHRSTVTNNHSGSSTSESASKPLDSAELREDHHDAQQYQNGERRSIGQAQDESRQQPHQTQPAVQASVDVRAPNLLEPLVVSFDDILQNVQLPALIDNGQPINLATFLEQYRISVCYQFHYILQWESINHISQNYIRISKLMSSIRLYRQVIQQINSCESGRAQYQPNQILTARSASSRTIRHAANIPPMLRTLNSSQSEELGPEARPLDPILAIQYRNLPRNEPLVTICKIELLSARAVCITRSQLLLEQTYASLRADTEPRQYLGDNESPTESSSSGISGSAHDSADFGAGASTSTVSHNDSHNPDNHGPEQFHDDIYPTFHPLLNQLQKTLTVIIHAPLTTSNVHRHLTILRRILDQLLIMLSDSMPTLGDGPRLVDLIHRIAQSLTGRNWNSPFGATVNDIRLDVIHTLCITDLSLHVMRQLQQLQMQRLALITRIHIYKFDRRLSGKNDRSNQSQTEEGAEVAETSADGVSSQMPSISSGSESREVISNNSPQSTEATASALLTTSSALLKRKLSVGSTREKIMEMGKRRRVESASSASPASSQRHLLNLPEDSGNSPATVGYGPLEVAAVSQSSPDRVVSTGRTIQLWQRQPHLHVWVSQNSSRHAMPNVWWMTPFPVNNSNFRLQCWDFTCSSIPKIIDLRENVVAKRCRIDNNSSVDVAKDGTKLACLVPRDDACMPSFDLRIYSLQSEDLGVCYFHLPHGPNAISVSLSPSANYVTVGLGSSRTVGNNLEEDLTVAKVFKLNDDYSHDHIRDIKTKLDGSMLSLIAIRWLPRGIVYSVGPLHHHRYQARLQRHGPNIWL